MQRSIATVIKDQGRRTILYRDTKGKTFRGYVTSRVSGTSANIIIWRGGKKVALTGINIATAPKQTNVIFNSGH